jgi:chitinase
MAKETFTSYWIGQEKIPLNEMPAYANVVPLAFVGVGSNYELDFGFLCQNYSASTIQGWVQQVRANGTKVLLSINSSLLADVNPSAFAATVQQVVKEWGVDGVDLDYEPDDLSKNQANVLAVVNQIRSVLGAGALITAPIFSRWLPYSDFLNKFAAPLDYLTTMDYTPYPDFQTTIDWYEQYAQAIGTQSQPAYDKLGIGVSCMEEDNGNNTPLSDVVELCTWEPDGATKQGIMLYTFSYDEEGRIEPPGTYSSTINKNLP